MLGFSLKRVVTTFLSNMLRQEIHKGANIMVSLSITICNDNTSKAKLTYPLQLTVISKLTKPRHASDWTDY